MYKLCSGFHYPKLELLAEGQYNVIFIKMEHKVRCDFAPRVQGVVTSRYSHLSIHPPTHTNSLPAGINRGPGGDKTAIGECTKQTPMQVSVSVHVNRESSHRNVILIRVVIGSNINRVS
jgi:hypothetical protein